jgi:hypothetical protein
MSTTTKKEKTNFTPCCVALPQELQRQDFWQDINMGKGGGNKHNEQTKQTNIHVLTRGNGRRTILEQCKRKKSGQDLGPMNTTSLGPRPSHLQELACPKDVQTRTLPIPPATST